MACVAGYIIARAVGDRYWRSPCVIAVLGCNTACAVYYPYNISLAVAVIVILAVAYAQAGQVPAFIIRIPNALVSRFLHDNRGTVQIIVCFCTVYRLARADSVIVIGIRYGIICVRHA